MRSNEMKIKWKKYTVIVAVVAVLLFTGAAALVYAVYYGYYHVNGFHAAKYPIRGVDVS